MATKSEFSIKSAGEGVVLYYCAEDNDIRGGRKYGPSMTDLYIVECCTAGCGTVTLNSNTFEFKKGDVFVIKPGQKMSFTSDDIDPRKGVWCAIDGKAVASTMNELNISDSAPFLPSECFDGAVSVIRRMIANRDSTDMGADYRNISEIYSLLGLMLSSKPKRDKNIWVEKALFYMECNYSSGINASDVALALGLNRSYFSTLFKSVMGVGVHEYLAELRVRKGVVLMRENRFSAIEASELVGLDPQTFSSLFKRITGETLKEFKAGKKDK